MKIKLTEYDLKTLKQDELGFWNYEIKTKFGSVKGSKIKTKEEAIQHCEKNLIIIIKSILSKSKK